jgi:hypothetical protein
MVISATQTEHNEISSSAVQKNERNRKINANEACCLAIVLYLSNVDSHISMLLLFYWFQDKARCVCLPSRDMDHGKTNTRLTTVITLTVTAKIRIV